MKSKRLLSFVLSAVMLVSLLFSCLSVEVLATGSIFDDTDSVTQELDVVTQHQVNGITINTVQIPYTVNPLYKDVISDVAPPLYAADDESFDYVNDMLGATFGTVEEAAASMRTMLKDRVAIVTANVQSSNSNFQAVIDELVAEAMKHTGVGTEGDYLLWHYLSYAGNVSYIEVSGGYQYSFRLNFEYYTTKAQEDELTVAVNNLKNELDLYSATDYEKVKGVYDYICNNIEYDFDNLEDESYTIKHSAYAALMHKKAVCQGYASLLYRLMLELGVDCRVIAGIGGGGAHGWNIVGLDGLYYNLDATWDATYASIGWPYEYFLRCDANFFDHYPYAEYATSAFIRAYPKDTMDYLDPYRRDFEIVDGVLVSYRGNGGDVVIPDGVTAIGDRAFWDKDAVTSVKIADTVKSIGEQAFLGCNQLAYVELPDALETIEKQAFNGCVNLTEIEIPETVKSIGDAAFEYCSSLESVELPEGLETIGNESFYGCFSLKNITIPASVTSVGQMAFYSSDLESITFLSKTTDIFDDLLTIPSSATIYGYAGSTAEEYANKYSRKFVDLKARTGDLDDDGEVTRDDAIHLLYHSLFPDAYPISEDCDYDGDGVITRDDAIHLLYHSLFPDIYPLQ